MLKGVSSQLPGDATAGQALVWDGERWVNQGIVNSVNGQTGDVVLDAGAVESIVAGDNITVDNTDPQNPIVSSTVDLSGYVPYTGATSNVDLGSYSLEAFSLTSSPTGNNTGITANGSGSGSAINITHSASGTKLNINDSGSGDLLVAGTNKVTVNNSGKVTVRRGSAADTDNIIEGQNGAGTTTFGVTGAGTIASTLSSTSVNGLAIRAAALQTANLAEFRTSTGALNGIVDKDGYVRQGNSITFNQNVNIASGAGAYRELGTLLTASRGKSAHIEFFIGWYIGGNADSRQYHFSSGWYSDPAWRIIAPKTEGSNYNNPVELEVIGSGGNPKFRLRNKTNSGISSVWVTIKITHDTLGSANTSLTSVWTASSTTGTDTSTRTWHKNNITQQRNYALQIHGFNGATHARVENADSASSETGLGAKGISIYQDGRLHIDGEFGNNAIRFYNYNFAIPNTVNDYYEFVTVRNSDFSANLEFWMTTHIGFYAISKRYFLPVYYGGTSGTWQKCIPVSSTGAYAGNDHDLEVNIYADTAIFRIRRKSGPTINANIQITMAVGVESGNTIVTSISNTGSGSAPTDAYSPTSLCQIKGKIGIGGIDAENPTALLHLAAGSASANSAPLKLTAGTNMTTPEDGAFEFDGTNLYFTVGGIRKTVTLT